MQNLPGKDDFHIKIKHINTLFQFVKTNKEDQFLEYISNIPPDEIDVNMKDENGHYLISFAIMLNNRKIVKKLIELRSRLDILDVEGYSILYLPIKFNYIEILDILLEYDKKTIGISLVNIKDLRGSVPLFYAVKYRNRYALQVLLSHQADANYSNNEGINALHLAVLKKDATMVRMLIKHVKNINTKTNNGSTPLHNACNFQLIEIVRILLENGADQNIIEEEYDFYPIFYSVVQNNIDITKLLIDYGANPNHQDYQGNTIIHYSIIDNHMAILDYILDKYPVRGKSDLVYVEDINSRKDINSDHIDPNVINISGLTIVHLMLYNYGEVFDKYLIKLIPHTNLNYQDNSGNTILHVIAEGNLWIKFEPLLNFKKLNIYIKNNDG